MTNQNFIEHLIIGRPRAIHVTSCFRCNMHIALTTGQYVYCTGSTGYQNIADISLAVPLKLDQTMVQAAHDSPMQTQEHKIIGIALNVALCAAEKQLATEN